MDSIKIRLKESFAFYYSVFLVVFLLVLVNINSKILLYVFILFTAFLLTKPMYIIPIYIISSLSANYFIAGEGISISRLLGFILILGGIIYQFRHGLAFKRKQLTLLTIIAVYAYFSSLFSLTGSMTAFTSLTQNIIVVLMLGQIRDINIDELSKLLTISAVITIIILTLALQKNISVVQAERLSIGDDVNVNRFAMMLAQLAAIVFAGLLVNNKSKLRKSVLVISIILSYLMLFFSGSRSATIGITGAIGVVVLYLLATKRRKFLWPAALLIIATLFFVNQIKKLDLPVIERFSIENVLESRGTHRIDTWETLVPVTFQNKFLFGYGLGGENSYALAYQHGLRYAAHNFVIDMFIQTGFIGILLFFSYFIFLGKKLKRSLNYPTIIFPIMILITAIMNGIGETIYLEKLFWNGMALSWLFLNNIRLESGSIVEENK